tara:strand:+ start:95 stop:478 length:384 start_codon:yes stop_codon:yes gene_type:complete
MKKIVSLSKIIHIIQTKGVSIELENRRQLDFNTYKTKNHAEILGFWNKADNCLWDAQLLGYKKQFSYDDIYYSNIVIGYIKMPNNNDKLLMKIPNKKWSKEKFLRDVKRYIYEYNKTNNIKGKLVLL